MLTKDFWLGESGAIVRACRTAAQTAIAAIGVGQTNLFSADLKNIAALSISAAVLSLLMSIDRNGEAVAARAAATAAPEVPAYGHGYGEDLR